MKELKKLNICCVNILNDKFLYYYIVTNFYDLNLERNKDSENKEDDIPNDE